MILGVPSTVGVRIQHFDGSKRTSGSQPEERRIDSKSEFKSRFMLHRASHLDTASEVRALLMMTDVDYVLLTGLNNNIRTLDSLWLTQYRYYRHEPATEYYYNSILDNNNTRIHKP